eukprot:Pompholyxophrys_punicea_v1_NODE_168_length_3036_cov_10.830594.p3 type:complete len:207 gc:universal NODE_168_length_3036_cov_10.830594:293-913(+)
MFLLLMVYFTCVCCGKMSRGESRPCLLDKSWQEGGKIKVDGKFINFDSSLLPKFHTNAKQTTHVDMTVCNSCYMAHREFTFSKLPTVFEEESLKPETESLEPEKKKLRSCLITDQKLVDFIVANFGYSVCDGLNGHPLAFAEFEGKECIGFRTLECLKTDGKGCTCSSFKKILLRPIIIGVNQKLKVHQNLDQFPQLECPKTLKIN